MTRLCNTLLLTAALLLAAAIPARATIHNISVFNFDFSPKGKVVQRGDTVRWTWGGGFHSTTSLLGNGQSWDSGILSTLGATFDLIITDTATAGFYKYECSVHPLSMRDSIIVQVPGEPRYYTFLLDDDQENTCLGNGSAATGWGLAILNAAETQLSVYVEHSVVAPTGAHIHFGAPCVDGGPIRFGFTSPLSPIHQTWSLSPANVAELKAGNLYVNVHTATNPGGEIRGQIVRQPLKFPFTLDEAQANGGAGTGSLANGFAVCELDSTSKSLSIKITHDVSSPIDGHVHTGLPGVEGGIRFGFSSSTSPINQTWNLDTVAVRDLMGGKLYINVHSTPFPTGEIRGQLRREQLTIASEMNGAKANGGAGTGSTKVGFVTATLSADLKSLALYAEHDIASPIDAHVHFGAPNVEGPIRFGFSSPNSPISETWTLTAQDLTDLLNGNLYVNIHSGAFPSGEIRGQLVATDELTYQFVLDDDQANSCLGTGSTATGNATCKLKKGGREMTIQLTHNVSNPIDGHIHLGAACVSGGILFGFGSPVSPIKDFWYLGSSDVVNLLQKELYANIHSVAFPVEEIRGQIENKCKCGDADGNGAFSIADAVFLINYIFAGGAAPTPSCRGDADGNGAISIADAVYLINFIFAGGPTPTCP